MPVTSMIGEIYKHNLWANRKLIERCATLSEEQLDLAEPGTYGRVRDTLVHLVGAESRYVWFLTDQTVEPTVSEREGWPGFPALMESIQRSGEQLIRIAEETPPDRILRGVRRGESYEMSAAVPLAQAINHATEHRAHVSTILSQHGIAVPELDVWHYSAENGLG